MRHDPRGRKLRQSRVRERAADEPLNIANIALLIGRGERNSVSSGAGAGRTADAMHIVVGVRRQVVVHHQLYPLHVYASRSDVCRNEHPMGAVPKSLKRRAPLTERPVRMQLRRGVSHRAYRARYPSRAMLRAGKEKHRTTVFSEYLFQ